MHPDDRALLNDPGGVFRDADLPHCRFAAPPILAHISRAMSTLFETQAPRPLADRLRPQTLADIVGQDQTDHGLRRGVRFVRVAFRQKSEPKAEESEPKSCAVCHKTYQPQGDSEEEFVTKPPKNLADDAFWLKKGAFKTAPTSHATCFACHSEDSGLKPAPSDCGICHKLLPPGEQIKLTEAHSDFDPKLAAMMKEPRRIGAAAVDNRVG